MVTTGILRICPTGHQYNVILLHVKIFVILVLFTLKKINWETMLLVLYCPQMNHSIL